MWNDDGTDGEGKQTQAFHDLWELLNDLDSHAEKRAESLVAESTEKKVAEDGEKLIMRRRRRANSLPPE